MGLTLERKREILKHVFKHAEAKSTLRLARANTIIIELMGPTPAVNMGDIVVPRIDDALDSAGDCNLEGNADV